MQHDDDIDRELDRLQEGVPAELRGDWIVVPRRLLVQVFLVGLLMGAGFALGVAGKLLDVATLSWAWPAVVVALIAAARFVPWWRGDRLEEQLRAHGKRSD